MLLDKYSFGIGDRFAMQGEAQLRALMRASKAIGTDIAPVWNKSNREHIIVGSTPAAVLREAEEAVKALGYGGQWFTDADHINMSNVDKFIEDSNFFTIDVADFIGKRETEDEIEAFTERSLKLADELYLPVEIDEPYLRQLGANYLYAIREAARIYHHIEQSKGRGQFVAEVSMDEAAECQLPDDLIFILHELAREGVGLQTIAPRFHGSFHKGVDYVGDLGVFAKQFEEYMEALNLAVEHFGLPEGIKLSIHSGSDKFSLYPIIGSIARRHGRGFHIKTAGTTWLEEVLGLAMTDDAEAIRLVKFIYSEALERCDELCLPYSTVIDINRQNLPGASEVNAWSGRQFASALRHIPDSPQYNPDMRQLVHVAYKIAAENSDRYLAALKRNAATVGQQVEENIYERHLRRLFDLP
ncbi:MAG: tagaturonate epimerase family protein [Tannerellaceae bacterium]|jgi:hypothetical protein|nr:tagaturonate epimerase family protein [Tannerellaceae bacterium]